jgi:hypothetical protein
VHDPKSRDQWWSGHWVKKNFFCYFRYFWKVYNKLKSIWIHNTVYNIAVGFPFFIFALFASLHFLYGPLFPTHITIDSLLLCSLSLSLTSFLSFLLLPSQLHILFDHLQYFSISSMHILTDSLSLSFPFSRLFYRFPCHALLFLYHILSFFLSSFSTSALFTVERFQWLQPIWYNSSESLFFSTLHRLEIPTSAMHLKHLVWLPFSSFLPYSTHSEYSNVSYTVYSYTVKQLGWISLHFYLT